MVAGGADQRAVSGGRVGVRVYAGVSVSLCVADDKGADAR